MAEQYIVKVDTNQMRSVANETRSLIGSIKNVFDNLHSTASSVSAYWEGHGYDGFNNSYKGSMEKVQPILNSFYEMVNTIEMAAGLYDEAETQNVTEIESLPDDVIS